MGDQGAAGQRQPSDRAGRGLGDTLAPLFDVPPTGKAFKIMSIDIHTIEGGKIVRSYHIEGAGAMRQLASK